MYSNDKILFNELNHNELGNPHPQYFLRGLGGYNTHKRNFRLNSDKLFWNFATVTFDKANTSNKFSALFKIIYIEDNGSIYSCDFSLFLKYANETISKNGVQRSYFTNTKNPIYICEKVGSEKITFSLFLEKGTKNQQIYCCPLIIDGTTNYILNNNNNLEDLPKDFEINIIYGENILISTGIQDSSVGGGRYIKKVAEFNMNIPQRYYCELELIRISKDNYRGDCKVGVDIQKTGSDSPVLKPKLIYTNNIPNDQIFFTQDNNKITLWIVSEYSCSHFVKINYEARNTDNSMPSKTKGEEILKVIRNEFVINSDFSATKIYCNALPFMYLNDGTNNYKLTIDSTNGTLKIVKTNS